MNQFSGAIRSTPFVSEEVQEPCCRPRLTALTLVAADVFFLSLAMAASLFLGRVAGHRLTFALLFQALAIIGTTVMVFAANGLYPALGTYRFTESKRLAKCTGFVQLAGICFYSAVGASGYQARTWSFFFFGLAALIVGRSLVRNLFSSKPWWGEAILLIGCGQLMEEIGELLEHDRKLGLHVAAVFCDGGEPTHFSGVTVLTDYRAALHFAAERKIKTAIFVVGVEERVTVADAMHRYATQFPKLVTLPPIPARRDQASRANILGGYLNIRVSEMLLMRSRRALKRALDIGIAFVACLVFLPVMLLIAAAIKLTSRGPLFFGHSRIAKSDKEFKAWKFRTMVMDADAYLARRIATDGVLREEWERDQKLRRDPRVTRVGAFLRKYSLDELPQLWNVLRSEMSLVGPRPICRDEVGKYAEYFDDYTRVRPGLTGLWQVSGRNEMTYEERVQLDKYYVNNWTLWLDLYIIVRTLQVVLGSRGAY